MAYCDRCDRSFVSKHALWQHEEASSMHWFCRDCDRDFTSNSALIQHMVNSSRHHYCRSCEEDFDDEDDLEDHYVEDHHYCSSCSELFDTEQELRQHKDDVHWYCPSCDRVFQSKNNLEQHLQHSSVHQPKRYKCPGTGCRTAFISPSALILHCESGACPSKVTRNAVNNFIVRYDEHRIITNPSRLIAGPDGSYTAPSSTISIRDLNRCFNGRAYECVLCDKEFKTIDALGSHLRSPVHADKIYRCLRGWPVDGCGKEFRTLSALISHMERGSCGAKRLRKQIDQMVDSLGKNMKWLTL